ncbi:uncharacterized protein L3040_006182 [Drepanopeziza brunnea f. sp. 'multigermtubi']|uniref:Lysophospholipase n=1 Tax=Marssonina brunnea f. sp. multigermtubi (strain MB_m1) TaxID=1072389 RepID=K1XLJ0_MARBU|nr:lysophospholipase [Drepanopeziza brunnea f. sp. 'multigermtubi' MB_m1]EKD21438.1 lysophospholipase [Drepanopeziza brunnea f. sp. 'multigermtubi' MB_m1]KAJ5040528.1 hypothetical protein L3040_006182 [Drepanopeziza brunnea f. sp. 'multigermtubi']
MLTTSLLPLLFVGTVYANIEYTPQVSECPGTPLVRAADGLSDSEEAYRVTRKAIADEALKSWLMKTNPEFGTAELPTVALTTSGGGYRSLLSGAGVIKALDGREESGLGTSGLYQALTYQAGLSGGGWLLSSMAGNNYPTISYLTEKLWKPEFQDLLVLPADIFSLFTYSEIMSEIDRKEHAGFDTTLIDIWGRLLSYQLLEGPEGGIERTLSSVATLSNFVSHNVPFPIITALGLKTWEGERVPARDATTYEFTPFEFGSWGKELSAFTPTKYLGTKMQGGQPTGSCTTNFDNLGYVLGTSSSIFCAIYGLDPAQSKSSKPRRLSRSSKWSRSSILNSSLGKKVAALLGKVDLITPADLSATYPNPFYKYTSAEAAPDSAKDISAQASLSLVDGGLSEQNNPIFPLLQPSRNVSVILVNDNSADTDAKYPNGSHIERTYQQSARAGLTRMPFIPSPATFVAKGLNINATFFGCDDPDKVTIVYLPNAKWSYESGLETLRMSHPKKMTEAMIKNGQDIATQGGDPEWPTCLGCAMMMKTGAALPTACTACFAKHCYYESGSPQSAKNQTAS